MKINKFKKLSSSIYLLELDNGQNITLYEDTLIKYNLLYSKKIDINNLNEILEYNDFAECYNESLKYISKKMRSKKEVEKYLLSKGYNQYIVSSCIEHLEDNKIINEELYVKSYINDRFYLSKAGPYKIQQELENMGIDNSIICANIENISEEEIEEKVKKYIEKKKKINSKYSSSMFNQKIKNELITLGFDYNIIEKYLTASNDTDILKKEYLKIYKKYSLKYSGYELNAKIKSYLYNKGYKIDEINSIIE